MVLFHQAFPLKGELVAQKKLVHVKAYDTPTQSFTLWPRDCCPTQFFLECHIATGLVFQGPDGVLGSAVRHGVNTNNGLHSDAKGMEKNTGNLNGGTTVLPWTSVHTEDPTCLTQQHSEHSPLYSCTGHTGLQDISSNLLESFKSVQTFGQSTAKPQINQILEWIEITNGLQTDPAWISWITLGPVFPHTSRKVANVDKLSFVAQEGAQAALPAVSCFTLDDPYCHHLSPAYNCLDDSHLQDYHKLLKRQGFVTSENDVVCTVKEFNEYRHYLTRIKLQSEQFLRQQEPTYNPSASETGGKTQ
ncbi:hypothetical protein DUI87_27625 [Hirundo rustica rustica]|uniref:Uncharacterized protein n=1 Tax=Hirundo rustica rustica TaxID=333673 RepID=A0A3M0J3X4_HIRRU|nr:hypothetical protein DUI87_27625 [Hirundo rustica rustica]